MELNCVGSPPVDETAFELRDDKVVNEGWEAWLPKVQWWGFIKHGESWRLIVFGDRVVAGRKAHV